MQQSHVTYLFESSQYHGDILKVYLLVYSQNAFSIRIMVPENDKMSY